MGYPDNKDILRSRRFPISHHACKAFRSHAAHIPDFGHDLALIRCQRLLSCANLKPFKTRRELDCGICVLCDFHCRARVFRHRAGSGKAILAFSHACRRILRFRVLRHV